MMNIAILGSCVSRDTCEYMPNAKVVEYVARQSVTSILKPHGFQNAELSSITSPFQKRMVKGDLEGDGVRRIVNRSAEVDLLLIDLVDERRGFFHFENGTTMTNSVEVEQSGLAATALNDGARLIEFGTEEHYEKWSLGFNLMVEQLRNSCLIDRTILLDIDWAQAVDGSKHPRQGLSGRLGRSFRRVQRGARESARSFAANQSGRQAWTKLRDVPPTEAERHAERAKRANRIYSKYRTLARSLLPRYVERRSGELRIDRNHKWGPQPFHYRVADYQSIVQSVGSLLGTDPTMRQPQRPVD